VLNVGALTLAGLAAVAVFDLARAADAGGLATLLVGPVAGAAYLVVDVARRPPAFRGRRRALLPHYLAYGLLGGALALAYEAWGLPALAAAAVPLVIARRMERAYLERRQRRDLRLPRAAAETARTQSASLEEANRLLRERSIAAMESLSAIVDARDPHAAGHSRRVRRLALAVGRELGLSRRELDVLGHAALFHDVGKVAIPDAILLKPGRLSDREWTIVREHPEEGARIIARLGFLDEALPAIRHHHERFDGAGYPDALRGEEIPLGARIIHVAEAADSMLTTKAYGAGEGSAEALAELRRGSGTQFCPRCVAALERALPVGALHADGGHELPPPLRAAS
jgi:putative nucleotidyltransferase with HDIG domain